MENQKHFTKQPVIAASQEKKARTALWQRIKGIRPLASSRLHFVFGRYMLVGLLSNLLDYTIFLMMYNYTSSVFVSTYTARGISMVLNYALVSRIVFHAGGPTVATFPKYMALVIFSGFLVWQLISVFNPLFGGYVLLAKLAAEALVYGFNFSMQRWLIFRRARRAG